MVYNLLGNGFPLGSRITLVYNIKPFCLLVLLVYNINNRSISSIFKSIPLGSQIPLVYNLLGNGFPLGSPIPLLYNIKPLGLLFSCVFNIDPLCL